MARACGADDIKNILHPALFRKLRFQMIDDSWSWVNFLPYFAQAGWDCHALNWFGHNGSAPHPEVGLLQRGIADVVEEIAHVAASSRIRQSSSRTAWAPLRLRNMPNAILSPPWYS